jgi:peptidoglycan/xylan/chitin deacetylase (PgdA/CDA1 family)
MKPHGIMFHHFCDAMHPKGQGAMSGEDLEMMLHHVGLDNILSAEEFQYRLASNKLKSTDVCLTFDDNLKCQYDVAYPVLKKYKITAFWFIYTSPFEGINEKLEVYRYYRTVAFDSIDGFYDVFFNTLMESGFKDMVREGLKDFSPENYLMDQPFYSTNDRKFRFIRDKVLKEKYPYVMDKIIEENGGFSMEEKRKDLWMDEVCIKNLATDGHVIGLHSHTHPTEMASAGFQRQKQEYVRNYEIIKQILGRAPASVSYPCSSYNDDTLKIMDSLGISIGFTATMVSDLRDPLTLPRNDHANVLKTINAHNERIKL